MKRIRRPTPPPTGNPDTRRCIDCQVEKELHEFPVTKWVNSKCRECSVEYTRQRRARSPYLLAARAREQFSKWYAKHPGWAAEYNRKVTRGIPYGTHAKLLAKQHNKCAICSNPVGVKKKDCSLDHCHRTGRVRGVLCHLCNSALGFFRDDPKLLYLAIKYLTKQSTN